MLTRRGFTGFVTSLPTGSQAPTELSASPLEAIMGLEVRRLRKSIGLTITELGAAAGISPGMISKIENGSKSPSLRMLYALAKAVNVPLTRLFAETDERRDCSFVAAGAGVRIERRGTKAGHLEPIRESVAQTVYPSKIWNNYAIAGSSIRQQCRE